MIAWQTQLNPEAIQKVGSYILTLQGTNPANGKVAQGTVWTDVTATAKDSLVGSNIIDSLTTSSSNSKN